MTATTESVQNQTHPLEQTAYFQREHLPDETTPAALTRAYLADVTIPESVLADLRRDAWARYARDYGTARRRGDRSIDELADERAQEQLDDLLHTPTMLGFRDRALDLSNRYEAIAPKGYASADSHFLGQAARLHEGMRKYAADFFAYFWGRTSVDPFTRSTQSTVADIQAKAARAIQIMNDREPAEADATKKVEIGLNLPKEVSETSTWDRETISLWIDENGKIRDVQFDELFDHINFCTSIEDLAAAYKSGQEITPAQMQILDSFGYGSAELPRPNEPVDIDTQHLLDSLRLNFNELYVEPLHIFASSIEPDMAEKLEGKSGGHHYATDKSMVGPFRLNYRFHDYGSMQFTINLDTSHLTNEEVYKLVARYIDVLKAFPRVVGGPHYRMRQQQKQASSGSAQA